MKADGESVVKTHDKENTTKKVMINIKMKLMKNKFP